MQLREISKLQHHQHAIKCTCWTPNDYSEILPFPLADQLNIFLCYSQMMHRVGIKPGFYNMVSYQIELNCNLKHFIRVQSSVRLFEVRLGNFQMPFFVILGKKSETFLRGNMWKSSSIWFSSKVKCKSISFYDHFCSYCKTLAWSQLLQLRLKRFDLTWLRLRRPKCYFLFLSWDAASWFDPFTTWKWPIYCL